MQAKETNIIFSQGSTLLAQSSAGSALLYQTSNLITAGIGSADSGFLIPPCAEAFAELKIYEMSPNS
jgi:hypothetical protein